VTHIFLVGYEFYFSQFFIIFNRFYMPPTNRRDQYSADSDNFVTEKERINNDNENSFRGLLLGLLFALLFGGGITALFLFNRNEQVPAPVVSPLPTPIVVPSSSAQPTSKETTIIREKTRELVPVPQASSAQPDINITVPDSKPSVDQPPKSEAPSSEKTTQPSATSSVAPQSNTTPQSPPAQ
jgi:hypothetical protein